MNTYVISPSADGSGTGSDYIDLIGKEHVALYGAKNGENKWGTMFANMAPDDLVIIAQGCNKYKKCYYAGFVKDNDNCNNEIDTDRAQARRLKDFVSLSNEEVPFNEECTYGYSNQLTGIYRLKDDNLADLNVINAVLGVISDNKSNISQ